MKYVKYTAFAAAIMVAAAPVLAKDEDGGDAATVAAVLPSPKPGMGQVVFFRPSGMGMAVKCTVREDGKMVGRVGNNRYYVIDAAPGTHNYTTKSEATDKIAVQIEPDETTYVKCKISMGIMVGRPNLSPSTEDEWSKAAPKIKPMEADKIAAEIAKDDAALASKGGAN